VIVFAAVFFYECKVYDMASAMFMAICLGLMARRAWLVYGLMFALGCVNRETMVLLVGVFAIHYWGRLSWQEWLVLMGCQIFLFLTIRTGLMVIFASAGGAPFWLRPRENVLFFLQIPWLCGLHWLGVCFVLWSCLRRWQDKPRLLRSAFVVMASALMALYLFFGWAFEVRVFAELFPVVWLMVWNGSGQQLALSGQLSAFTGLDEL